MPSGRQGSIHLFCLAGVDLYLHWSWFLVAAYEIQGRQGRYSSILWNVLEYLALFLIVLMHEFGHAMACRQVGGTANRIMLWPLGGVAYVNPPQRPGATLWSIAAGPLVNVALLPLLYGAVHAGRSMGWPETNPDAYTFLATILFIDISLLVFNLLPIYPRSLLWFGLGRARSLMAATVLGLLGAAALIAFAVYSRSLWTGAICIFIVMNCWGGLQRSRELLNIARLPRRDGFACPSCRTAPPIGNYWRCGNCEQSFDTFETRGACPQCSARFATTTCLDCRVQNPVEAWVTGARADLGVVSGTFSAR